MEDVIIEQLLPLIDNNELIAMQILWEEIYEANYYHNIAWEYIVKHLYSYAIRKKRYEICEWLENFMA